VVLATIGVDPWVNRGTFPLFFLKWRGRPVFLSPLLFRVRHFCTNAQGIHWMIGTVFVKFKSAQSNLGRGSRGGAVAYVRRKVPIGYNGAPQICPQKYLFPLTDPQTALPASSLDPSDL